MSQAKADAYNDLIANQVEAATLAKATLDAIRSLVKQSVDQATDAVRQSSVTFAPDTVSLAFSNGVKVSGPLKSGLLLF